MIEHELDRYWETVVSTIQDGILNVNKYGTHVSVNDHFGTDFPIHPGGTDRPDLSGVELRHLRQGVGERQRTLVCAFQNRKIEQTTLLDYPQGWPARSSDEKRLLAAQ